MRKNPRKRVIEIKLRPNTGPSKNLFPQSAMAILECGHEVNCGVAVEYAQARKRMACSECGSQEVNHDPH